MLSITRTHACRHAHAHQSDWSSCLVEAPGQCLEQRVIRFMSVFLTHMPFWPPHVALFCLFSGSSGSVVQHVEEIIILLYFLGHDISEHP